MIICPTCKQSIQKASAIRRENARLAEERDRYKAALGFLKQDGCMRVDSDGQLRPCRTMASCPREAWCSSCIATDALAPRTGGEEGKA